MSRINPESAFVRVMFDLPTPVAIKMEEAVTASGKSKKAWLRELIEREVSEFESITKPNTRKKRK